MSNHFYTLQGFVYYGAQMPQTVVEKEDSSTGRAQAHASATRKVIPAYPGETVTLGLNVYGPRGHLVEIIVEGLGGVAMVTVSPSRAEAPYTASLVIEVLPDAKPGLYPFDVRVRDETEGVVLGVEHSALLILRRGIAKELARHYSRAKQMFIEYGSNGLLWYTLRYVYPSGAIFRQLKEFYELTVGRAISGGTLSNILARMIRKGIITRVRGEQGDVYKLLIEDFDVVKTRVDISRIRLYSQKQHHREIRNENKGEPYAARLAFEKALDIRFAHGVLPAAIFLVHTLAGARETGLLLYWSGDMFIVCENKTGFCHVFHSNLLAYYFRLIGVKPGVFYSQTQDYQEGWRIARRYIRKYYKTFPTARRLHYLLKEEDLVWYDEEDEALVLDIYYYGDGSIGVRARDNTGEEVLWEENIKPEQPVRKETRTAFPKEHLYEPNEETYFHRSNIW